MVVASADWGPVFWQPGSIVGFNEGGYDAHALVSGIASDDSLGGFSNQLAWVRQGAPVAERFEAV